MKVNGKEIFLQDIQGATLSDLILHFKLKQKAVAVELNAVILPRGGWDKLELKESDQLELIRFVGGG